MKSRKELIAELQELNTEAQTTLISIDQVSNEKVISLFIADYIDTIPVLDKIKLKLAALINECTEAVKKGGSVVYVGAGTSGRLGVLDASECPPTFGVNPYVFRGIIAGGDKALRTSIEGAEDDKKKAVSDYNENFIASHDVVIGITASSRTPYVLEFLAEHKRKTGKTGLIVCNPKKDLDYPMVDILLSMDLGSELLAGSTRLKSGTMTKIVLNMISTITMINLGKVYKNYMVDLIPTNEKLKARAIKIFIELTNEEYETAANYIERADYQLKTALVMFIKKVPKEEANRLIKENNGFLKHII